MYTCRRTTCNEPDTGFTRYVHHVFINVAPPNGDQKLWLQGDAMVSILTAFGRTIRVFSFGRTQPLREHSFFRVPPREIGSPESAQLHPCALNRRYRVKLC